MKDRIRQLMESQHMTQQTFANFIGMSAASLSSIFNDRTKPTVNTIMAIKSKIPDISLDWLMDGEGPMYKTNVQAGQDTSSVESPTPGAVSDLFDMPQTVSNNQVNAVRVVQSAADLKYLDKTPKKITEIRVFYDDSTYESFVPKK